MESYQKAAEALRSGEEYPIKVLKNAALGAIGGGTAVVGSNVMKTILPAVGAMINKYVPDNISIAGLNKIDPRIGKFIKGAMEDGYDYGEIRQFLEDKVKTSEQKMEEQTNLIEKESPELHGFISEHIKKGRNPFQAGAAALKNKRFENVIKKLITDHKTTWPEILENVYGASKGKSNFNDAYFGTEKQPRQSAPPETNTVGPGQQALMQILAQINQKLGQ